MGPLSTLKPVIINQLLDQFDYILVVVNSKSPDVVLPPALMADGQPVGLHVGWRMAVPIPDLSIDENGITGTLSFNRNPFFCRLPWPAVVQVSVGEEHLVWIAPPAEAATPTPPEPIKKRPQLRVV